MTQTDDSRVTHNVPAGASLEALIDETSDLAAFRSAAGSSLPAAADFWRVPMEGHHLDPRIRELVLVGMHAAITTFNIDGVERHTKRALAAGATAEEVIDVLITIVAQANHALYFSIPILEEELAAAGLNDTVGTGPDPDYESARQAFIAARGFWNTDRDAIARLIPDYYKALDNVSTESWNNGPLSAKERAFVCIGIDSTVTHNYEPGLRRHIRNALSHGATRDEILEVLQLTGVIGLEGYILGARILFGHRVRHTTDSE